MVKIHSEVAELNLHIQKNGKNNSRGFYIALGVCLIAVGVAAWTTYDSVVNYAAPQEETQSAVQSETAPANNTVSNVYGEPESSSGEPESSSEVSSEPEAVSSEPESEETAVSSEPVKPAAAAVTTFSYPVSSREIVQKFSLDPVYCKTTLDWRAHTGLDLSAKQGEAVKSMAEGKVTKVYKDDSLGNTVIVSHGTVEAWYCGLNQTNVKENDSVKAGQELGTVGSVPIEQEEASHLHLVTKVNGEYVDPLTVLR